MAGVPNDVYFKMMSVAWRSFFDSYPFPPLDTPYPEGFITSCAGA